VAQTYNIHVDQGSTYTLTVSYIDASGAVVNLTNYEARMQVRETVESTSTLASFTSSPAAGLAVTAGAGTVTLTITSTQTAAYSFKNGVYDLEIYDNSVPAQVVRLIQGRFVVNPEVTR
tara:strand:+ start:58 stop:414 length:357 start_codon:yes stop_codon:yes gene_type:complete